MYTSDPLQRARRDWTTVRECLYIKVGLLYIYDVYNILYVLLIGQRQAGWLACFRPFYDLARILTDGKSSAFYT